MSNLNTSIDLKNFKTFHIRMNGRTIGTSRNYGALFDIRKKKPNHFFYRDRKKCVNVNVDALGLFEDTAVIQVADEPEHKIYTITKRDFMRHGVVHIAPDGEYQLSVELERMSLTVDKSSSAPRVNELKHIENDPLPAKPARKDGWKNLDLFSR